MHAYPLYGILNIIFCPKTGVFGLFGMLGTPKPMDEIVLRHHIIFLYAKTMRTIKHIKISNFSKSQKCDAKLLLLILNGFSRKSTLWVLSAKNRLF